MGLRDEEVNPTEKQKHQAELRKQLLRPKKDEKPIGTTAEKPVKEKGKHRKEKK